MDCPVCGNEYHEFNKKPERYRQYDRRLAQCNQCGLQFTQRSVIDTIYVLNPITHEREEITLDQFNKGNYREHILNPSKWPKANQYE